MDFEAIVSIPITLRNLCAWPLVSKKVESLLFVGITKKQEIFLGGYSNLNRVLLCTDSLIYSCSVDPGLQGTSMKLILQPLRLFKINF